MVECKVCANADNEYCFACDNGNQFKPMTNADRIRAMSDEELAKWIALEIFFHGARKLWDYQDTLEWLRQESSEKSLNLEEASE